MGDVEVHHQTIDRVPAATPEPRQYRLLPLLPPRLRPTSRPHLAYELVLIGLSYWIYSLIRNAVPEHRSAAMEHGSWLFGLERSLFIDVEPVINQTVDRITWLIVGMNYYYATLHFIVTVGVLGVRRRRGRVEPVRRDAFDAHRLGAVVRAHGLHARGGPLGPDARSALPTGHVDGDRRDREPFRARRGRWRARTRPRVRGPVRAQRPLGVRPPDAYQLDISASGPYARLTSCRSSCVGQAR